VKNPVMLVVYIGAILTTALYFLSFAGIKDENSSYILAISLILWFTVLFANFA
jgi:K+-transporting ATPase ATPase B chain